MRNLIFSLMLSVFSLVGISQTYEVSVSGEVTDMEGEPVEGQAVDIMTDSAGGDFYYFNTVFTDDDGHYEDEFDVPDGDSGTLTVSTMSCGMYLSESDEFSEENDELEFDFVVCSDMGDECHAMFFYHHVPADYMTIQFTDMSFGDPTEWDWDFGDGGTSDEQNPIHVYDDEGEYLVTLTIVADSGDCTSTFEELIWVENDSIWPDECHAMFFYYPVCDSGDDRDDELTYQFVDISYGNPVTWEWDFGDGETSEEQNPIHEFEEEGEYEVCLTISNPADSCESTYCEEVYISHDSIDDCFGWFEYTTNDLTVDFEGFLMNSQHATFSWEFGDGTTGTGDTVSHTYAAGGMYEVTMYAVDTTMDCDYEYTEMIWVGDSMTFTIYGNVFIDDSMSADVADVYLMSFDTIGDDLINIATTSIDSNGYYEFEDVGFAHCIYFIQAELTDGSAYYGDYVPTYHLHALNWEEAWPVFPFPAGWSYDVYLLPAQGIQSGDGNISGTVTEQENRGLMSDVEILLLNQDNTPLTYLRTDENGEFDFPELEFGTYIVYTEIVGIVTTPVTVTLGESNPDAQLNIVVTNGEALLGIGEISSRYINDVSAIYPNPVSENAGIEVGMKEAGDVQVSILNQYGQVVFAVEKQLPAGSSKVALTTQSLSPGLYIVSVKAKDGIATVRKFVKLR